MTRPFYFRTSTATEFPPAELALPTGELIAEVQPDGAGTTHRGSLITARDGHTGTLLVDGAVLIMGGTSHMLRCHPGGPCVGSNAVLSSAELFK
jgi:hypothetical protein